MKSLTSPLITQVRISKWLMQAKPLSQVKTWTEKRLAIQFEEHTYILSQGQVFQCAHCGAYDPEVTASAVIEFFRENFGIKPIEIEVTVSVE